MRGGGLKASIGVTRETGRVSTELFLWRFQSMFVVFFFSQTCVFATNDLLK